MIRAFVFWSPSVSASQERDKIDQVRGMSPDHEDTPLYCLKYNNSKVAASTLVASNQIKTMKSLCVCSDHFLDGDHPIWLLQQQRKLKAQSIPWTQSISRLTLHRRLRDSQDSWQRPLNTRKLFPSERRNRRVSSAGKTESWNQGLGCRDPTRPNFGHTSDS